MPGLMEADDDGLYVVKFRGAGQGPLALVAEIVCGELARGAGLRVPELVLVEVDPVLGRAEPDPEIQELLAASAGLNLGVDFLPSALPFTAAADVDPEWAAEVMWFDWLVMNVDRTPRNPNMLCWHRDVWLIDHGAALYPQHAKDLREVAHAEFAQIEDHVLKADAAPLEAAAERLRPRLDPGPAVDAVPTDWLGAKTRDEYVEFLTERARG